MNQAAATGDLGFLLRKISNDPEATLGTAALIHMPFMFSWRVARTKLSDVEVTPLFTTEVERAGIVTVPLRLKNALPLTSNALPPWKAVPNRPVPVWV